MKQRKTTLKQLRSRGDLFCACRNLDDLSRVFKLPKKSFVLTAFEPTYYHFSVPKANGQVRSIEAPEMELKKLQRQLNAYLQAVYYLHQSDAAYGFIITVIGNKNVKNICTNAEKHLGCDYLLNADFDDFFHQIKTDDVAQIFRENPFQFDKYTAYTLAKICTYKGRLPMGAPTSPVLSNFYTLPLDKEISIWAKWHAVTYTRFVDDLSFSTKNTPLTNEHYTEIKNISQKYHLKFGEDKTRFFSPSDTKIVTGLALNETVDIVPEFYRELDRDIQRLQAVIEVNQISGTTTKLKHFKQEIMGKIEFVKQVEGVESDEYIRYLNAFYDAQNPADDLSMRWMRFGNYF